MKSMFFIALIFTVFTLTVKAQSLIPATSEDQEMFDQQLEQAAEPQKPVKSAVDTKVRKDRFGSIVKEEAVKLKAADVDTRKEMGQRISDLRRKNPAGAAAGTSAAGNSSSASDGKNSAPGLNNTSAPGNSGNHKK